MKCSSKRFHVDSGLAVSAVSLSLLQGMPAFADSDRASMSFFGSSGILEMPTALMMPDADIAVTAGYFYEIGRGTVAFQITPRLQGAFRYSAIERSGAYIYGAPGGTYYDRSFDLSYQIASGENGGPAVAIGLRDFGGTGLNSGEYIVATQPFSSGFDATLGIGWGSLGSEGGFRNPLSYLFSSFRNRPGNATRNGLGNVGTPNSDQWFKGPAALFGGIQYHYGDHLTFAAEYSSDAYDQVGAATDYKPDIPFNFGVSYHFDNGFDLTGAYLYGNTVGAMLNYRLNPRNPPALEAGREGMGPVVVPRSAARLGWDRATVTEVGARISQAAEGSGTAHVGMSTSLRRTLAAQGQYLIAARQSGSTVQIWLENDRFRSEAEALGRTARALTTVLPREVDTIILIPVLHGMALSAVRLQRDDLEALDGDLESSWKMLGRTRISEAPPPSKMTAALIGYPRFTYKVGIYTGTTFSNPDDPLAENGLELGATYALRPGLELSTRIRQPLVRGGSGEVATSSDSKITRVRSNAGLYEDDFDPDLTQLTLAYFARPATMLYSRLSMGYFEEMYAGVSGEVLWKPVSGPLALGAELNYAMKREPEDPFGLGDYKAPTGYLSAYYDLGGGYLARLDAGRYLARDWGGTLTLQREFDNGFVIGAYATLTDVSFDDFGEGSFDKGIFVSIPFSWLWGHPSPRSYDYTWKPINGDGGARMQIPDQLYDIVRQGSRSDLQDSWGRFWR